MPQGAASIRVLSPAEVETLVDWAAAEGWNPGHADAAAFRCADPDGFLGAFVDGEMVAGISAVAYGDDFGFIGLYICRPDMRGRGHGRAVWEAGMARLGDRTIGLDGVPEQQANYRSMGFEPLYSTVRFSGRIGTEEVHPDVRPVASEDAGALAAFEANLFPAGRAAFLARWLAPPHVALMLVGDGRVMGYGVARKCREGFKIGPLFAQNGEGATRLLVALANRCDGIIQLDVPGTQTAFAAFLADRGFAAGFETARMYRGLPPPITLEHVFAITSLELG